MRIARLTRGFLANRHWATCLALLALIAAVGMPPVMLSRNTFSYIATFDITQSMDVQDVSLNGVPMSRLDFARAAMREALGQLPCGSRVGWSVFTGQQTLLLLQPVEVCRNYDALLTSLDSIDGRMRWTNWSRIAEGGLYSATRVAQQMGQRSAIVFITDGQEAPPLLPSPSLARDINPGEIKGWLIGVGGDQPAPIPKTDANGNRTGYWTAEDVIQVPATGASGPPAESHEELSELRGHYLATVADRIGFHYQRLVSAASLSGAMLDARFAHREPIAADLRWCPALLALLLLTWRFMPDAHGWQRLLRFRLKGGQRGAQIFVGHRRSGLEREQIAPLKHPRR